MKKVIIYTIISLIAVGVGFIVGSFVLNKKPKQNHIAKNTEYISTNTINNDIAVKEVPTSISQEKVSINTEMVEQIYYEDCKHTIEIPIKNTKDYINLTKEELEQKFPNWEIKEFSQNKVILYKEENNFCNEHFLVKDEDGYVTIYTINNKEEIQELLNKTDISIQYLAEVDKDNLKKGMVIYTKKNLNKLIEDFE